MSAPAAAHSRFARVCSAAAALIRTSSKRVICATIFANVYGTARNWPGHEARLCGQESQIAVCGSHSAGIRNPSFAGVCAADRELRLADFFTAEDAFTLSR